MVSTKNILKVPPGKPDKLNQGLFRASANLWNSQERSIIILLSFSADFSFLFDVACLIPDNAYKNKWPNT